MAPGAGLDLFRQAIAGLAVLGLESLLRTSSVGTGFYFLGRCSACAF
jgi:hypothetical protein